jgi:hypothetical protein
MRFAMHCSRYGLMVGRARVECHRSAANIGAGAGLVVRGRRHWRRAISSRPQTAKMRQYARQMRFNVPGLFDRFCGYPCSNFYMGFAGIQGGNQTVHSLY